jgi:hypothetical protein
LFGGKARVDHKFIIKALSENIYTEMLTVDGKTVMHVYGEDGKLLDVMEEVASYFPPHSEASKLDH